MDISKAIFNILQEQLIDSILDPMAHSTYHDQFAVLKNNKYVGDIIVEDDRICFYGANMNKAVLVNLADPNCFDLITRAIRHEYLHSDL